MLTRLLEVLAIDILSNWCDLKTVAKVVSAFCNKLNRLDFLCLLADPTFVSHDSGYRSSYSFWRWIVLNSIKLQRMKAFCCNNNMLDLVIAEVDRSKVTELQVIPFEPVHNVANLINNSVRVKTLMICDFYSYVLDESLNTILSLICIQILSGLVALTITSNKRRVDHHNFVELSNIANACTQLRVLLLELGGDCNFVEH